MTDAVLARLAVQEALLAQILAALQPPEQEVSTGLEDLVQALVDLTVAVQVQGEEIKMLRSAVSGCYPPGAVAA